MGREGLSFSTRWGGPSATDGTTNQPHPNYQSFKLYTNYDGARHGFGTLSVSDQSSANPDLFASYAALDATGTTMTIMVLNKDPSNTANVTFSLNGFNASTYSAYTVGSTSPGAITTAASTAWSPTQSFAPYTITLLVVSGTQPSKPADEWYLNPDDVMIPASGTGILNPRIISGTTPVTLTSAVFDAFEGATACAGSLTLTNPAITPATPATITVNPRQHHRLLPLHRDWQRRHNHADRGRLDRRRKIRRVTHPPVGQQPIGQRWSGPCAAAYRELVLCPVRLHCRGREHSLHHFGRHAFHRLQQRDQRDCTNQRIGDRFRHFDAAFVGASCHGYRAGPVCARRSFGDLH